LILLLFRSGRGISKTLSYTTKPSTLFDSIKLRCDERFAHEFTACRCVFEVITLVWANQGNYYKNRTTCSKRMHKTLVATQLYERTLKVWNVKVCMTGIALAYFFLTSQHTIGYQSFEASRKITRHQQSLTWHGFDTSSI